MTAFLLTLFSVSVLATDIVVSDVVESEKVEQEVTESGKLDMDMIPESFAERAQLALQGTSFPNSTLFAIFPRVLSLAIFSLHYLKSK